jgi:beta-glucosidase
VKRLSYTTFKYSDLSLPTRAVPAGQPVGADVTVANSGKVPGDEVVQVYLKFPDVDGEPQIALRGFQRIHLEPGLHVTSAIREPASGNRLPAPQ